MAESGAKFRLLPELPPDAEVFMEAYRIRSHIEKDGTLTLSGLPFREGEEVEVIVLAEVRRAREGRRYPLRGKPLRYEEPFAPVADGEWQALHGRS